MSAPNTGTASVLACPPAKQKHSYFQDSRRGRLRSQHLFALWFWDRH